MTDTDERPSRHRTHCRRILAAVALLAAVLAPVAAQNPASLDQDAIIAHLTAVLAWYHDATTKVQGSGLPSDAIYQDNLQNLSAQAVQLAFEAARAEAALIAAQNKSTGAAGTAAPEADAGQPDYEQMRTKVAANIAALQAQMEALDRQIARTTSATQRQNLVSQRNDLQGEIELYQAVEESLGQLASFLSSSETSTEGLLGQINKLARAAPEVTGAKSPQPQPPRSVASQPATSAPASVLGQALVLWQQMQGMHTIEQLVKETQGVGGQADTVRKPLRDMLAGTLQSARALAQQQKAVPQGQPGPTGKDFQQTAARFKQVLAVVVPLSQETALLNETTENLEEWRNSIWRQAGLVLESLLLRMAAILVALGLVFLFSELSRRAAFRFVPDPGRRRHWQIVRRFATGFLVCVVLTLGFVSEFSSLATFAGFMTAGIALALQAVLLSVVAYFFLIGRWGLRVGDRISISGVTGDVIDVGVTRLYLMELAGTSIDLYPTGRIVVFSNSVLFQPTTPLFQQIPGTEYTWHEVAVALAPGGNHKQAQEKLLAAVNSVYAKYRQEIESQHAGVDRALEVRLAPPVPDAKLKFADAGLELVLRFPVAIRRASETDDEVTRAVLDVLTRDADVKAAVAGSPNIRAAMRG